MTFCPGARGQLSGALMQKLAKGSVTTVAPFALDRAALALRPTKTNETGSVRFALPVLVKVTGYMGRLSGTRLVSPLPDTSEHPLNLETSGSMRK